MGSPRQVIGECSCGAVSEIVCGCCGKTVCSVCSSTQIGSFAPPHIRIKHYCAECASDVRRNVWGELYWKKLTSQFA